MIDILVLGSLNMDLVVRAERMPGPGETLAGGHFSTIPGGKGANQAAAAARLGQKTAMIGRVGKDAFGPALLESLAQHGVDVAHVAVDPALPTGTATILIDASGENRIIIVAGANGAVSPADVDANRALLTGAKALLMQFEVPMDTISYAAQVASAAGVAVYLNPAPVYPVSAGLMRHVSTLILNEHEAEELSGLPVRDRASAEKAAHKLVAEGAREVIITMGADGALLLNKSGLLHVSAPPVDVVDTTAAGDAFCGGFVAARLAGHADDRALRTGVAAGALACTRLGAQTSLPGIADVEDLLRRGW